ncbi:MAG: TolB family protein [Gammaproteobacteria bacterium]
MNKTSKTIVLGMLALVSINSLVSCETIKLHPSNDRHMENLQQLTFDGDNGEAYFSADGASLIFQSNRGGYACDKIWTMDIDGSVKRMVSPDP